MDVSIKLIAKMIKLEKKYNKTNELRQKKNKVSLDFFTLFLYIFAILLQILTCDVVKMYFSNITSQNMF